MILKLRSGDTVVVASAWSAGADGNDQVFVKAHGGTIGLTCNILRFTELIAASTDGSCDLCDLCEDPKLTMQRLAAAGASRA